MKYCTVLLLSSISSAIATSFVDHEEEIRALAQNKMKSDVHADDLEPVEVHDEEEDFEAEATYEEEEEGD
jgi:hypothetical protein